MIPSLNSQFNNMENIDSNNFSTFLTNNNINNFNDGTINSSLQKEIIENNREVLKNDYINLVNEYDFLVSSSVSSMIPQVINLLKLKIDYLRNLFNNGYFNYSSILPHQSFEREIKWKKVFIPTKQFPRYNFIGRIIGPRGSTTKNLEFITDCKIRIRGKGSIKRKDLHKYQNNTNMLYHLNEPLHVLIEAEDTPENIDMKLNLAEYEIKKIILSVSQGDDTLKKSQLIELAKMNGTYRKSSIENVGTSSQMDVMSHHDEIYSFYSNYLNNSKSHCTYNNY